MITAIASLFRTLNVQLLYKQGFINKILKGSYLMSVYCFKWWIKQKRQPQLAIIDNYDGNLKLQIDLSKTMGASLYWTGFHEFNEMRFLNTYLRPDMTFVDVGANQGEFALFASRRVPQGKVLAFEPMSFFFDRLSYNVALNNITNITCYKLGLSDHAGGVSIYFNSENESNHEGLASLFRQDQRDESSEVIQVAPLDAIVGREAIDRIDFIKIDVEGSEWAVLRGSEHVLERYTPTLMVELNDETAALAGYKVDEMVQWLKQFGYVAHEISRDGLVPLKDRPAFCNAVFLVPNTKA